VRLPAADDEAPFAVVKSVLACISEGRHGDIASHLTDDFQFELPYGGDFGGPFDKASFDAMQRATFKMFTNFRIGPTEVHVCADPGKVVVEYESEAQVAANGRPYRNRYVGVFEVRDHRIASWKEFHNPEAVTKAFAP
jgi:ketosteroid isomerase-like protein